MLSQCPTHKSSRRKTKWFSSYFRFPTSHTTVRVVPHTAVPYLCDPVRQRCNPVPRPACQFHRAGRPRIPPSSCRQQILLLQGKSDKSRDRPHRFCGMGFDIMIFKIYICIMFPAIRRQTKGKQFYFSELWLTRFQKLIA
jgi:hypothetical protein